DGRPPALDGAPERSARRPAGVDGIAPGHSEVASQHRPVTMPRMRPAFLVALCVAVLGSLPDAAPRLRAQAPATLTVDLVVTDTNGRPVTSLRPEELIIRLDGRPQTVTHIRP